MNDKIFERIKKLLRLAENKGATEAEIKLATSMAFRLMREYNISEAKVRASMGQDLNYRVNEVVIDAERHYEKYFISSVIERFDSKLYIRGSKIVICTIEENLEFVEYLYHFLRERYKSLFRLAKRRFRAKDRKSYYYGLTDGILDLLDREAKSSKEEYQIVLVSLREALVKYEEEVIKPCKTYKHEVKVEIRSYKSGVEDSNLIKILRPVE